MRLAAVCVPILAFALGGCMLPRPVDAGSYDCPISQAEPASDAILFAALRLPSCAQGKPLGFTYFRAERPQFGAASGGGLALLTKAAWLAAVDAQVRSAKGAAPIIYIHGYNNDQAEADARARKIRDAIGFARPVIALTWPSYAEKTAYFWDETNAEWSFDQAREIIDELVERYPHAIIIAHSMGNRLALDAIADLRSRHQEGLVDRLVMASPDVDRATLRGAFGAPSGIGLPVTVYASTRDQALSMSWRLHGYPRAGDLSKWASGQVPDYVFDDVHGVEIVDTSNTTHSRLRDPLYHADFIETPEGAADLCRVLMGLPPGSDRFQPEGAPRVYWALRQDPDATTPCFGQPK